jgi:hypothetical protein
MAEPDKRPVTLEELLVLLQKGKNGLRGLCLFLVLLLGFSLAARAATLFPNRSRGWNKIPTIVVLGQEGDSRNQLVNDAVVSGINSSPRSVVVLGWGRLPL